MLLEICDSLLKHAIDSKMTSSTSFVAPVRPHIRPPRAISTKDSGQPVSRIPQTQGSSAGSQDGSLEFERNLARPNTRPSSAIGGPKCGRDSQFSNPPKRPLSARAAAKGFESRLDDKFIDMFSP